MELNKKLNEKLCYQLVFVFIGLFAAALGIFLFSISEMDSDFYWHAKLGEYIVQNKKIMDADTFSWLSAENGYTEYAHSWLGSIIVYGYAHLSEILFGFPEYGAVALGITNVLLLYCITYFCFIRPIPNKQAFYKILLAAFSGIAYAFFTMTARPIAFSNALFVVMVWLLYRTKTDENSKAFLWLPVVSLVWANIHGGTVVLIPVFIQFFIIVSFIKSFRFRNLYHEAPTGKARFKTPVHLLIALFSSFFAGCINPYGISLYTYAFLQNNAEVKEFVAEFQPAYLAYPIVSVNLFIIVGLLLCSKKVRASAFAMVFGSLYLAGFRLRYGNYMVLLLPIFIASLIQDNDWKQLHIILHIRKVFYGVSAASLLFVCGAFAAISNPTCTFLKHKTKPKAEALEFVKEHDYKRMFSSYNIGGYLIYYDIPSFVDSRADLFGGTEMKAAISFSGFHMDTIEEVENYIQEKRFDAYLLDVKDSKLLISYLKQTCDVVYEDDTFAVLEPRAKGEST